jgi:hypothetical protein
MLEYTARKNLENEFSTTNLFYSSVLMKTFCLEKILIAESVSRSFRSRSFFRVFIRKVSRLNGIDFNSPSKSECAIRKDVFNIKNITSSKISKVASAICIFVLYIRTIQIAKSGLRPVSTQESARSKRHAKEGPFQETGRKPKQFGGDEEN